MIAFVVAMDEEAKQLRRALTEAGSFSIPSPLFSGLRGKLGPNQVALLVCGIGKACAAAAAAFAVSELRASLVVSVGTAGAMRAGMRPGDFLVGSSSAYFDADVTAFGYAPGQMARQPSSFAASQDLMAKAASVLGDLPGYSGFGAVATGDVFLTRETVKSYPALAATAFDVVDMEAAACAQICHAAQTAFLAVKFVADTVLADGNAADFESALAVCAERIGLAGKAIASRWSF